MNADAAVDVENLKLTNKLTPAERIAMGKALSELTSLPGWKVFATFLQQRKSDLALNSLYSNQSKSYFRGRIEELDGLLAGVEELIAEGEKTVRVERQINNRVFQHRFGASDAGTPQKDEESIFDPMPQP